MAGSSLLVEGGGGRAAPSHHVWVHVWVLWQGVVVGRAVAGGRAAVLGLIGRVGGEGRATLGYRGRYHLVGGVRWRRLVLRVAGVVGRGALMRQTSRVVGGVMCLGRALERALQ